MELARRTPNAATEWQAMSWGWRRREIMVACPLEGLVRSVAEDNLCGLSPSEELTTFIIFEVDQDLCKFSGQVSL
jgi:hypothetical protein